jgi:hypothetical protein
MERFCVYQHRNLTSNEIFYVGAGLTATRPYSNKKRNKFWHLEVKNNEYSVEILKKGLTFEKALRLEKKYIKMYGRRDLNTGVLVNLTNGGRGAAELSPISRELIRLKMTGIKMPPRTKMHCKNNSKAKLGHKNPMFGKISTRRRSIKRIDPKTKEVVEFPSVAAASFSVNGDPLKGTHIVGCCKGTRKIHRGYYWEYA